MLVSSSPASQSQMAYSASLTDNAHYKPTSGTISLSRTNSYRSLRSSDLPHGEKRTRSEVETSAGEIDDMSLSPINALNAAQTSPGKHEENGIQTQPILISVQNDLPNDNGSDVRQLTDLRMRSFGNMALSSAPGKKVRLNVDPNLKLTRSPISRDLNSDFERIASYNLTTVINLLDDQELSLLNAPWDKYEATAHHHGLEVIRFPTVEGGAPPDIVEFDKRVVIPICLRIRAGKNVLVHCRGGIGRAGLVACCWLLRERYCKSAEKAISFVRARRSIRAIETLKQEDFIYAYEQYVQARRNTISNDMSPETTIVRRSVGQKSFQLAGDFLASETEPSSIANI